MNTSTTCREQTVAMVLRMRSHVVTWTWTFVTLAIVSVRTARRRLHLSMASLRLEKATSTLTKGKSSSFLSLQCHVYIYIEIPIFSQYFFATTNIFSTSRGQYYDFLGSVTPSKLVPGNTYTFTRTEGSTHPFAIKGCPNLRADARGPGQPESSFTYTIPNDHHVEAKFVDYFCPSHPEMRHSLIPIVDHYVLMYDGFPRTIVAGVSNPTNSSLLYEISYLPSSLSSTSGISIRPAGGGSPQELVRFIPDVSFAVFRDYECSPGQTVHLPSTYSFVDNGNNRNGDIVVDVDVDDALCSSLPNIVDEGDAPIFG